MRQQLQRPDVSLAQLGEHLPYKQRVTGSSPVTSTNMKPSKPCGLEGFCLLQLFMHSTRLTGRVYFFVKCAASGYFRLFDVSPVSDRFLLCLALLCVLEVDNLERCLGKGIDGQVSVDLQRHGNRLVTQKILCDIKRDTGGLQVGCISVSQAV